MVCGRGVPTKVVCDECMKMCGLGGKNSVVKGLNATPTLATILVERRTLEGEPEQVQGAVAFT